MAKPETARILGHTFAYALGRLFPGIVNLLALAWYARALGAEDFGLYGLAMASVGVANTAAFHWIVLAIGRYLPAQMEAPGVWMAVTLAGFGSMVACTAAVALPLSVWLLPPGHGPLALAALTLLWCQAAFDVHQRVQSVQERPLAYAASAAVRAVLALAIGLGLLEIGLGAVAPVIGWALGSVAVIPLAGTWPWRAALGQRADRALTIRALRFGLPLSIALMLRQLVTLADRAMIAAFIGIGTAGAYAAAADLTGFAVTLILSSVPLATLPRALRAIERGERAQATQVLEQMGGIIVALGLPLLAACILLAEPITAAVLGAGLGGPAAALLPWLGLATVLSGVKSYYFDTAFVIGQASGALAWLTLATGVVNLALNAWWIPLAGAQGAALASCVAIALACVGSAILGRRYWRLPNIWRLCRPAIVPTATMSVMLVAASRSAADNTPVPILPMLIVVGGATYVATMLLTDAWGLRTALAAARGRREQAP